MPRELLDVPQAAAALDDLARRLADERPPPAPRLCEAPGALLFCLRSAREIYNQFWRR